MKPTLLYLLLISFFLPYAAHAQGDDRPYLLMISYDGFRYDYADLFDAPNFKRFITGGVAAEALIPSFPSKTFPNHYTIMTGLYPGHHGLVDNTFYDAPRDITYTMRRRDLVEDPYFYGGLPLWQLVQDAGLRSASYFWVGSEAPIAGRHPDYWYSYDESVSNEARIEQVIRWFQLPADQRPHLVSMYFSLVDSQGHRSGPEAEETRQTVLEADRLLGLIMEGIAGLEIPVNIMITSDHGMYAMPNEASYHIPLPDLLDLDNDQYRVLNSGTHVHVYAGEGFDVKELWKSIKAKENHFRAYLKEKTPKAWHYREHARIGDLILAAEPGYQFLTDPRRVPPASVEVTGAHGFDPYACPEMGGIFYAAGPNFQSGLTVPAFENVHIYPLVAELFGIDPPQTDGKLRVLKNILKP